MDWCGLDGCDSNLQAGVTLRQRISPSSRQEVIITMCANLKLSSDKQLEYTLIDCEEKLKPLCMRGDPKDISIIQTAARLRKKKRMKKKKIYKLRQKQLMAKMLRKSFVKRHKRKRTKRQAPPVEMCATAGKGSCSITRNIACFVPLGPVAMISAVFLNPALLFPAAPPAAQCGRWGGGIIFVFFG